MIKNEFSFFFWEILMGHIPQRTTIEQKKRFPISLDGFIKNPR